MKNKNVEQAVPKKKFVRVKHLGRRPKYVHPFRLSVLVEGNISLALEEAVRREINGKTDLTGVVQDALKMYIDEHGLVVPPVEEYARLKLVEVTMP